MRMLCVGLSSVCLAFPSNTHFLFQFSLAIFSVNESVYAQIAFHVIKILSINLVYSFYDRERWGGQR